MKTKSDFQKQANEEIQTLQKEIDSQEKLLRDLKQQQNAMNAVIAEIKQLRAVHAQMIAENEKSYADLKQEFEGFAFSDVLHLFWLSKLTFYSLFVLQQSLMKNWLLLWVPSTKRWQKEGWTKSERKPSLHP